MLKIIFENSLHITHPLLGRINTYIDETTIYVKCNYSFTKLKKQNMYVQIMQESSYYFRLCINGEEKGPGVSQDRRP